MSPLLKRFRSDGIPGFRLSLLQHRHRRKFLDAVEKGEILLEKVGTCPCGGASFQQIAAKERLGLPFGNYLCLQCGVITLSPRIAAGSLPKYYAEYYHPLVLNTPPGAAPDNLVRPHQGKFIFEFLRDQIPSFSGPISICEVGCASGTNLLEISQGFAELGVECALYGSEYEDALVNKARSRGIHVVQGDVLGLLDVGVCFDLIVMSHVFEHMTDLNGVLATAAKLLKPSGQLFIEVPGIRNLSDYQYDLIDYFVNAHTYSFNFETLRTLLSRNGFVCLKGNEIVQGVFRFDPSAAARTAADKDCPRRIIQDIQELEFTRLALKQKFLKKLLWPLFKFYYYLEYFFVPKRKFCLG